MTKREQEFEFVELYVAVYRLASEWNIPDTIAERIVRGVLRGGQAYVRGKGHYDIELRDISKEIGATLMSTSPLTSLNFDDVTIDFNGLLEHGRPLVPPLYEPLVSAAIAHAAGDETKAINFLAEKLETNPNIKRDDAWSACREEFPALSERGFRSRIWPQARQSAGLETVAASGTQIKTIIRHG